MSVKQLATAQYQDIVDRTAKDVGANARTTPPEGWIATARKAIGMSGSQLGKRLGVTRARISMAERSERAGAVTLQTMTDVAKAMNCNFVYAIVPQDQIQDVIRAQAFRKAAALVGRAADHMALERQSLSKNQNERQTKLIADELMRAMPADLWSEPESAK